MGYESLTPRSFSNSTLVQAMEIYVKFIKKGKTPLLADFENELKCSTQRASVLLASCSWAYKVKQKEKAQIEAKRKKAC